MSRLALYAGRDAVLVQVDYECSAEAWWDAARASKVRPVPHATRPLLGHRVDEVIVSPAQADAIRRWASALPGWGDQCHPLLIGGRP